MQTIGTKIFQETRINLNRELIPEACENLLQKNIKITAKSIEEELEKIYAEKKIDLKYIVKQQSIGRQKYYKSIWKKFQKKQNLDLTKKISSTSYVDEFELRDKMDMLQQDYIELLDESIWLKKENNDLKQKVQELSRDYNTSNVKIEGIKSSNSNCKDILHFINGLLQDGPVSIVHIQKDSRNEIIIKSHLNKITSKLELPIEYWLKINE
ncbi:hypothetical protein MLC35_11295 [Sulfurimonas sp. NW7]|uniref:hypothetical protein n=1 Tax=Sulfurimonas sp. NW7 TaxID=2922727 RepID=UPI003DA81BD2